MGQEALQYVAGGRKATADWKGKQNQILGEIRKPSALDRFNILPAMSELVQAVPE
jgi:hypothetical protein